MTMQIRQIKVSDIVPTKDNNRKIDVKEESFIELMESIKAGGVRVPVHVRPFEGGKYELRAGQRRWTAAKRHKRHKKFRHGLTRSALPNTDYDTKRTSKQIIERT